MNSKYILSVAAILTIVILCASCKKEEIDSKDSVRIDDRSLDSFTVNIQPIGDVSGGTFNEFTANPTGFLSLLRKAVYGKVDAKENHSVMDAICYLVPQGLTNSGTVYFVTPDIWKNNFTAYDLGWRAYPDEVRFYSTVYSKRTYGAGLYYAFSDAEFDLMRTPEQVKEYIDHSVAVRPNLEATTYKVPYFRNSIENSHIFAIKDTKGFYSILRVEGEQSNLNFQVRVKRSYSTD